VSGDREFVGWAKRRRRVPTRGHGRFAAFAHPTNYSLFAIRYSLIMFMLAGASSAGAVECTPYCDFTHDYGPYDLTYKRPGLYAFPLCAPNGDCSPRPVYSYPRGVRITVRPRRAPRPPQ